MTKKFVNALLLFVVAVVVVGCTSQKVIVHGVDERDANEIIVLLNSKGVPATKVQSTVGTGAGGQGGPVLWDIEIPTDQSIEAMSYLSEAGLPKRTGQNLLQIFGQSSLVPSATQEKIKYEAGLAQQIGNTIKHIDGVIDANVIVSFPEIDPLTGKSSGPITASVFVKHNGVLDNPNLHLRSKIRQLVAASVTGLSYDNVTVVGERAMSPVPSQMQQLHEEPSTVLWSIEMAQNSVFRFQTLFFSLIIIIVILLLCIVWMAWKLHRVIRKWDKAELMSMWPLEHKEAVAEKKEEAKEGAAEAKPQSKDIDKEIEDI